MAGFSDEDFSFRTLIKKVVATETDLSVLRQNARKRQSQGQTESTQRRISNIEVGSPSLMLRSKVKEKLRRSSRLSGSATKPLHNRRVSVKKAATARLLDLYDRDTPRTILKNFSQTEREVSVIIHKKAIAKGPPSGRSLQMTQNKSKEESLSDMSESSAENTINHRRKKKPLSIAQFQKGMDAKQERYREINSSREDETGKNTSFITSRSDLSRSFKLVPDTPAEPESIEKKGLARRPKKRRMINIEDFEKRVDQKLVLLKGGERGTQEEELIKTVSSLADSSDIRSFKLGFDTPLEPESVEKKGLSRKTRKHRIINVEHFEERVNQNIQQLKGSQECFIDPPLTDRSAIGIGLSQNNTEIVLSNTALYTDSVPPQKDFQDCSPSKSRASSLYREEMRAATMTTHGDGQSMIFSDVTHTKAVSNMSEQDRHLNDKLENDVSMEDKMEEQIDVNNVTYNMSMEVEDEVDANENAVRKTVATEDIDFEHIDRMAMSTTEMKILSSTKLHEFSQAISFEKILLESEGLEDSVFQSVPRTSNMSRRSGGMTSLPSASHTKRQKQTSGVAIHNESSVREEITSSIEKTKYGQLKLIVEKQHASKALEQVETSGVVEKEESDFEGVEEEKPASEVLQEEGHASNEFFPEDESALAYADNKNPSYLEMEELGSEEAVVEPSSKEANVLNPEDLSVLGRQHHEKVAVEDQEVEKTTMEEEGDRLTHQEEEEEIQMEVSLESEDVEDMSDNQDGKKDRVSKTEKEIIEVEVKKKASQEQIDGSQKKEAQRPKSRGYLVASPAVSSAPINVGRRPSALSTQKNEEPDLKEKSQLATTVLGKIRGGTPRGQNNSVSDYEELQISVGKSVYEGFSIASPAVSSTPIDLRRRSGALSSQTIGQPSTKKKADKISPSDGTSTSGNLRRQSVALFSQPSEGPPIKERNQISSRSLEKDKRISKRVQSKEESEDAEEEHRMSGSKLATRGSLVISQSIPPTRFGQSRHSGSVSSSHIKHSVVKGQSKSRVSLGQSAVMQDDDVEQSTDGEGSFSEAAKISPSDGTSTSGNLSRQSVALFSQPSEGPPIKERNQFSSRSLEKDKRISKRVQSSEESEDAEEEHRKSGSKLASRGSLVTSRSITPTRFVLSRHSGSVSSSHIKHSAAKGQSKSRVSLGQGDVMQDDDEEQSTDGEGSHSEGSLVTSRSITPTRIVLSRHSGSVSSSRIKHSAAKGQSKSRLSLGQGDVMQDDDEEQSTDGEGSHSEAKISPSDGTSTSGNLSRQSVALCSRQSEGPPIKERNRISSRSLEKDKRISKRVQSSEESEDAEEEHRMSGSKLATRGSLVTSQSIPPTRFGLSRHSGSVSSSHIKHSAAKEQSKSSVSLGQIVVMQGDDEEQTTDGEGSHIEGSLVTSQSIPPTRFGLSRHSGSVSSSHIKHSAAKEQSKGRVSLGQSGFMQDYDEEQRTYGEGFLGEGSLVTSQSISPTHFGLSRHSGSVSSSHIKHSAAKGQSKSRVSLGQSAVMQDDDEEQSTDGEGSQSEELSISKSNFLRVKTQKIAELSSSVTTPHYLKPSNAKLTKKPPIAKGTQKKTDKASPKKKTGLPSSQVKQWFVHCAKMPVARETHKLVEASLNTYFRHLSADLEAFASHAGRKTVIEADVELLLRRQRLLTDTMPLNALIERYLPLQHRKLLIPVATSGNKVVLK
ncbi:centromere protein T isoform X2 [Ambystoma mexicanum]|uniref:centromere protein T isoform X2 n=1 Tax=Ambystoma mexicanum TaxID=8296 RepID=UPI0037E99120